MSKKTKNLIVTGGLVVVSGVLSLLVSRPASAGYVDANCGVSIIGKNNDGVSIVCGTVTGGQARGRADCRLAPDVYTRWIRGWTGAQGGWCVFNAVAAIIELRAD